MLFSLTDRHHEAMYAYYTASRWFGLAFDVIFLVFLAIVSTTELYSVTDSSTAGRYMITLIFFCLHICAVYLLHIWKLFCELGSYMS
jgi:hypothetical protein